MALSILFFATSFGSVYAVNCVDTAYGSLCSNSISDFDLNKTVSKSNSTDRKERITGIKKGDSFIFYFRIKNNTLNEATVSLQDNLPTELERVGGIGYTEKVVVFPKSDKIVEMTVKVKDSEFLNRSFFEKCVVNKAYIYKDKDLKDTSTATVCYGDGFATAPSLFGSDNKVLGSSLATPSTSPTVDTSYITNNYFFNTVVNTDYYSLFNIGYFTGLGDSFKNFCGSIPSKFNDLLNSEWVQNNIMNPNSDGRINLIKAVIFPHLLSIIGNFIN